jgi:hypothetical protein
VLVVLRMVEWWEERRFWWELRGLWYEAGLWEESERLREAQVPIEFI